MKQSSEILLKFISVIFIISFSWIIINAIFLGKDAIFNYSPLFLIFFTIIDINILIIFYKKIIPKIVKYRYLPIILFLIFFGIAVAVSYNLRLYPSWDMGAVFDVAKAYSEKGYSYNKYLYTYPNNIAITGIFISVFKIFKIFNITDYITGITVFNALIVTLTVIILYYAVNKMYGKEKALMALIISIFTTPLYLYSAVYYTDTMSMFFCILSLLIYLFVRDEKNKSENILLQILFGITLGIGFMVKITSIFIIIAILVEELLNMKFKNLINNFKVAVPVTMLTMIMFNLFSNNIVIADKHSLNFNKMPLTYWLLTGSIGNGGFNREVYSTLRACNTYEERNNTAKKMLIKVMEEYTVPSFIKHINEKLKFAWGDGTYYAPAKINRQPVNRGELYEYTAYDGEKTDYYKYFPQTMHISMLILMVVVVANVLRKRNYKDDDIFLFISVLGIMVFLIIWENRSRYILTLLPIMLILKVRGIEILSNIGKNKILELNEVNVQNPRGEDDGK